MSSVALMDARSIAATAANGGKLTAATDLDVEYTNPEYHYNASLYEKRVYNGWAMPNRMPSCALARTSRTGPRCLP